MVLASTQNLKKGSPTLVLENPFNTPFLTWSGGVRAGKLTHRTGCSPGPGLGKLCSRGTDGRNSGEQKWFLKGSLDSKRFLASTQNLESVQLKDGT